MLIDKGVTAGEVITIKLTSGEELIGRLVEENDNHYKLAKPMVLTMGQQGLGMAPYLFTVSPDKDVPINKSAVTVAIATDKEMANSYTQGTTGIKLV